MDEMTDIPRRRRYVPAGAESTFDLFAGCLDGCL